MLSSRLFLNLRHAGRGVVVTLIGLVMASSVSAAPEDHFVTTWKTDNPGTSGDTEITIPMVGGPYDVDWDNDQTFDLIGQTGPVVHDFGAAGTYTVRIRGNYDSIRHPYRITSPNTGDAQKLLQVDQWGTGSWTSMECAFCGASNLVFVATDTPDFSAVTNMSNMFFEATLANPDTTNWDVSSVTDMGQIFYRAENVNPDTGQWDTSSVTIMGSMFFQATSANPNTSNWNTSSVTSMGGMFLGATSANPNTSNWNTSSVTNMGGMFFEATSANPDTSGWNTASVSNMGFMFVGATSANPNTSNWNTGSVTNMAGMFFGATSANPDASDWNTGNVTSMVQMFSGATSANPDTSGWTVSALDNAERMFNGSGLSIENYDSLLESWSTQNLQPNVLFGATGIFYCSEAANTGRAALTNAPNSWAISDAGQGCPGDVALSTTRIDFGDVALGGSSSSTITVTNDGATEMVINAISDPGDGFTLSGSCTALPVTLMPNEECDITVTFSPDSAGSFASGFSIETNKPDSPSQIDLSGLSTATYTVGGTITGLEGSGLVLQNIGGAELVIAGNGPFTFPAQTDGTEYEVTVSAEPQGQQCDVVNGKGALEGSNVDDVTISCLTIRIAIDVSDLLFSEVELGASEVKTVTIRNSGEPDLVLEGFEPPPRPFSIDTDGCSPLPLTLASNEQCNIEVSFAPERARAYSDELVINSNAVSSPDRITLRATVAARPVHTLNPLSLLLLIMLSATIGSAVLKRRY